MIRTDRIYFTKKLNSLVESYKLKEIVEKELVAAKVNFTSYCSEEATRFDTCLEIILENPISLRTVDQIIKSLSKEKINVRGIRWENDKIGPFERGYLGITIS